MNTFVGGTNTVYRWACPRAKARRRKTFLTLPSPPHWPQKDGQVQGKVRCSVRGAFCRTRVDVGICRWKFLPALLPFSFIYEFHFEGFANFNPFKSKASIQEYRNEIQYSHWTCAWIIWCMFSVQCEELRINHLTLIHVVTMPCVGLLVLVSGRVCWGL